MVSMPLSVSASMTRWKPSVSFRSASAALASVGEAAVSNMVSSGAVAVWRPRWHTVCGIPVKVNMKPAAPQLDLRPLDANVSIVDQAYMALKGAIVDADIYGHREEIRLDERQLSRALGVSRTPIREAMTLLEQEGFLRTIPRRGVFIVRKTKKEIIEIIQVCAALESMAGRLATTNASDEQIAALRHLFDEFHSSAPSEHLHEYSDANIAFHQAIINLSGSQLMSKTIENLFVHVRAIRRMTISQKDRASRSIADHMRIIQALERRDTELAERLVRQHSLDLAAHVDEYCDFLG